MIVSDLGVCIPNPCQNNGSCIDDNTNPRCICPDQWTGQFCENGKIKNNITVIPPIQSEILFFFHSKSDINILKYLKQSIKLGEMCRKMRIQILNFLKLLKGKDAAQR